MIYTLGYRQMWTDEERSLGDFTHGRYGWMLDDACRKDTQWLVDFFAFIVIGKDMLMELRYILLMLGFICMVVIGFFVRASWRDVVFTLNVRRQIQHSWRSRRFLLQESVYRVLLIIAGSVVTLALIAFFVLAWSSL